MSDHYLRDVAETRLAAWAHNRSLAFELAGGTGASVSEIIRERAQGGSASTAPNQLTGPEARCAAAAETLQTEQAFRALPEDQRSVVGWKYLRERSVSSWGEVNEVSHPERVLEKALLAVGRDLVFGEKAAKQIGLERRARKDEKDRGLPPVSLVLRRKKPTRRQPVAAAPAEHVSTPRRRNNLLGLTCCGKRNILPASGENCAKAATPKGPA